MVPRAVVPLIPVCCWYSVSQLAFQVADMFIFVLKECHAVPVSLRYARKKEDVREAFTMDQGSLRY